MSWACMPSPSMKTVAGERVLSAAAARDTHAPHTNTGAAPMRSVAREMQNEACRERQADGYSDVSKVAAVNNRD